MAKLMSHRDALGRIRTHDLYDLSALDLNTYGSLLVSMHVDQRFLASRAEQIASFLHDGGTVIANGHLAYPFLPGMNGFHPLENYGLRDLAVRRLIGSPDLGGRIGERPDVPARRRRLLRARLALAAARRDRRSCPRHARSAARFHLSGGQGTRAVSRRQRSMAIQRRRYRRPDRPATSALDVFRGGRFVSLAILDGGAFYHHAAIHGPRYRDLFDRAIYMPELAPEQLEGVKLLIVPDRINPDLLRARRQISDRFCRTWRHAGGARRKSGGDLVAGCADGRRGRPISGGGWRRMQNRSSGWLLRIMNCFRRCRSPIRSGISTAF